MKNISISIRKLAHVLILLGLMSSAMAQSIVPFVITNRSEFPDDQVYVGLVGKVNDVGIWFDGATQTVKTMQVSDNTVPGPTLGGNPGPGGSSMYANCFTKLSNIPNKTLNLPPIASARIFIAFKNQLYLYFFGNNGGYSAPDLNNPTDPNQGIRYEILEFTYNTIGLWVNTTRVDNYQYPMGLEVWGSNIPYQKVGEILNHQQILDLWKSRVPASFQGCYDATLGIIHAPSKTAPFKEGGSMYNYFDSYVNAVWARYTNEDLTMSIGDAGVWKGRVTNNQFVFTRSTDGAVGMIEAKPNTQEILEGKGVLAHDVPSTPTANDLDVQKHFCAAFNRGAINPNAPSGVTQNWGNEADYFKNNTYNEYVKFWHSADVSYNAMTYAFCYDDVFEKSSTIMATSPTKAIITIGGFANAPAQVLTSIVVSPATATLNLGGTKQFTATGYDQNGGTMNITPTWTGTNSTGLFTATAAGTFTIVAQSGSISGTATVNVTNLPANLAQNKPVTVSTAENAGTPGSAAVDGNAGTRWSSAASDPQWITVDLQNTYAISKVVLNWETAAAKSYQVQVSNDNATWTNIYTTTTGAAGIATLNISGSGRYVRVYGTARTTGYGYSLWEFEVYGTTNVVPCSGILVNPSAVTVLTGATTQLSAVISPSNATNKSVTWTSNNTAVASVNSSGVVTGVTAGTASITAKTQDGGWTASSTVTVTSSTIPVTSVTVNPATASINVGATTQLTATVSPSNATNKTVSWTSSNTGVATVSTSGIVTAVAAGSASITVTTQSGAKTATCAVTVTATTSNLAKNKPVTVSSTENAGTPASAAVDGNAGTRWSSAVSDPQWIVVDLQATYNINKVVLNWETAAAKNYQVQVSADNASWTNIYTTTAGVAGVATLNVTGTGRYVRVYGTARTTAWGYSLWEFEVYGTPSNIISVTGVGINPPNPTLYVGSTIQLTATITPSNATNKNVTWTSSNSNVASVNSTGLVTGIAVGTATITVTTQDGQKTATINIPVLNPTVSVISVSLAPASVTLPVNGTSQLTANVLPSNATNKTISWASSNTAVATVSTSGLVTAKASGTATITVTTQDGAKTATSAITVSIPNTNIALNKPATASTIEGAYTANMANDGNVNTRWGSAFTDPQWITIDLQSTYTISQVVLKWEAASAKSFQIQVSTDNATWTNIYTTTTGAGGTQTLNVNGNGRYVRMYGTVRNTGYGYSLYEFEVYGLVLKSNKITNVVPDKISEVTYYPNPVISELTIKVPSNSFNEISLIDLTGKIVLRKTIESNLETMNLESLESGIYILNLSGTSENKIYKIVKK